MRAPRLMPTVHGTHSQLPIPGNEAMSVPEPAGPAEVMRIALAADRGHRDARAPTVPASKPEPGSAIPRGRTT